MNFRPLLTAILLFGAAAWATAAPERLVILHTNDTHSIIDPTDNDNRGGIARRKALIDSVRAAEPNVLLIDAGDVVQGSLYFNIYGGEVEQKLMNALGYDIRILGNHEFDNGVDSLAAVLSKADAQFLATNYDLSGSPLATMFEKYAVREIGGRKIGFIALNLNPTGMISEGNYDGVVYNDVIEVAEHTAWWLKHIEGCDMVIALTHLGYDPEVPPGDVTLARSSRDIDIIIGGHSHDTIDPSLPNTLDWRIPNADGRGVLVTQVGKQGKSIGEITVNLDDLSSSYRLIPVNSRLDKLSDPAIEAIIEPYRAGVDFLMRVPVGTTMVELPQTSAELLNWASDVVYDRGSLLSPDVDFAILNKGGLRRGLPKGTITEGQIKTMLPFANRIVVMDITGADLLPAFKQMAEIGGNGLSSQVHITYRPDSTDMRNSTVESVTVNGRPLDPSRTYRVATIDYLANGGDYMPSLKNHVTISRSTNVVYDDVLAYLRGLKGKARRIKPSSTPRFVPVK
ncbi:MAG: bifunctional metallophosphatase/5'-nucleotidase [Muribaculaceae bacterium]|nr:bifunctional metallophosphatase/5'-nucleotidase [Muribaculaceae bacterium]